MTRQPATSFSISFYLPFNRAGGRTSNVRQRIQSVLCLVARPFESRLHPTRIAEVRALVSVAQPAIFDSAVKSELVFPANVDVGRVFTFSDPLERVEKMPNKSRQINRRGFRSLDGFRRLEILGFTHDFSCRSPAVSALLRSLEILRADVPLLIHPVWRHRVLSVARP